MQIFEVITDETLRETKPHGTAAFPFEYYYDNIKEFRKEHIEWHWHNELEFVMVETGPVDCLVGNERIRMEEGEGIFVNSGVIHRYESPGEGGMPNILFSPEFIAPKNSLIHEKYVKPIITSEYSYTPLLRRNAWQRRILDILVETFAAANGQCSMRELNIHTLVLSLWSELYLNIQPDISSKISGGGILMQSRLQLMLQFIFDHYTEKITLQDISDAAGISKSEALRCFHSGVQTTPVNYLIEYRLGRALKLLETTHDTISDIALTVGFDNAGYFNRMFKKAFGRTPSEFRL